MATIDNLSIEISANADIASRAFDRMASSASRLRGASADVGNGLRDVAQGARDAGTETHEAGRESGTASSRLRQFGRAAQEAGENANKGTSGIASFWQALKRVAYMRFLRYIVKEIAAAFKEGITNLYHWSDALDGHFAKSMDQLATSVTYLKNSLGAMVAPLLEMLIPVLDAVIDKVVDILNSFNMLISALSGSDTYTIAKKAAQVWDESSDKAKDSAKSAADEIKRTILGFDEINKLQKKTDTSSSSSSSTKKKDPNYGIMFEEKPLTGWLKDLSEFSKNVQKEAEGWPDWLKWLLGIGAVALGVIGIKLLLDWVGSLLDKVKGLIALKIPDWLRWLFGGGGGGDGDDDGHNGIDIPDHIDIPDANIQTNLTKGDWSLLNKLKDENALVKVGLQHWGWYNIQDWIGNAVTVAVGLRRWAWSTIEDWIGKAVTVDVILRKWGWKSLPEWTEADKGLLVNVGLRHWGWTTIEDWVGHTVTVAVGLRRWGWDNINDWIGNAVTVAIGIKRWGWSTIEEYIGQSVVVSVGLKHWGWTTIEEWIGTAVTVAVGLKQWGWKTLEKWIGSDKGIYVNVGLMHWGWTTIEDWIGRAVTINVGLKHWGWTTIQDFIGTAVTVAIGLKKWGWATLGAWTGADGGLFVNIGLKHWGWSTISDYIGTAVTVSVSLNRWGWETLGKWTGADNGLYVNIGLKHWGWSTIADWIGTSVTVSVGLKKWGWDTLGKWTNADNGLYVNVGLKHWGWVSIEDWIGTAITVAVNLKKWGWTELQYWIGTDVTVAVALAHSGWTTIEKYIGTSVTVAIKLAKDGWDSVHDYLSKNYTDRSGGYGGGSTRGSGSGGSWEEDVDIGLKKGWTGTVQSSMNLENLSTNVSVGLKNTWGLLAGAALVFLGLSNLRTDVTVDAKPGKALQWNAWNTKFKIYFEDSASVTINASAGDGLIATYSKLKPNISTSESIELNAKAGIGFTRSGGTLYPEIDTYCDVYIYLQRGNYRSLSDWIGSTITVKVNLKAGGGVVYDNGYVGRFAGGGVIERGAWNGIPKYEGGTNNAHGTMFIAGEAGPEVVGHVGGRTEVLNRSQLASTMYAAVRNAMQGVQIAAAIYTPESDNRNAESDYNTMYKAMFDAFTAAMSQNNERDKEKVQLLREISAKEFNATVSTSQINREQERSNRRAGTVVTPVY